jgi:acyl-CoA dehydrogenase
MTAGSGLAFELSAKVAALAQRLTAFMDEHVYPNESRIAAELAENRRRGDPWAHVSLVEDLKTRARSQGLWNLFLPPGPSFTLG